MNKISIKLNQIYVLRTILYIFYKYDKYKKIYKINN